MAWLADSYRLLGTFGTSPSVEVMPKARAIAEQALAIDPNLAEAYATIGSVAAQFDRDYPRAEAAWQRALAADPHHVRTHGERAMWSCGLGAMTPDEALVDAARAAMEDPLNAWAAAVHSFMLGIAGRHPEAVAEGERAIGIDADSFIAQWMLLQACTRAGEYDRALGMLPELLATSGRHNWALASLAWLCARTGRPDAARAVHDELEARSRSEFVGPFWLAATASAAGLPDLAVEHARRAVSERDPMVVLSRHLPQWDALRADPRFEEITREVWTERRRAE